MGDDGFVVMTQEHLDQRTTARRGGLYSAAWARRVALLFVCLLIFLLVRLPLWQYPAQTYADTWGYVEPAMAMLKGDFSFENWHSERGLTYPLFLMPIYALAGEDNQQAVAVVQVFLGLLIMGMLFLLGWKGVGSSWMGALLGVCYALNVSSALFEMTVLAETLTLMLVLVTVLLVLWLGRRVFKSWENSVMLFGLAIVGVLCALLALSKHLFVGYWLVVLFFLSLCVVARSVEEPMLGLRQGALRQIYLFIVPVIAVGAILFWSLGNWRTYGWFTFNPLSGINLSNVAGGFIEYADSEECQDYVHLYLNYRQREVERTGTHSMTIYRAWQDRIDPKDIRSRVAFERLAFRCSLEAIMSRPDLYLATVRQSARLFWDPALYSRNPLTGLPKWLADRMAAALQMLRILFYVATLLWLCMPIMMFSSRRKGRGKDLFARWWESGFLLLSVWYVYVVASAGEFGENRRYKAVIEPLIPAAILMITALFTRIVEQNLRRGVQRD
ncbi:MAG: hypothetical protein HPY45_02845 [Anaerolineae bacterium]|nr:hypothetical protein [Anaerolineae bacterium]